jgi:AcrR family transcriptional regulator
MTNKPNRTVVSRRARPAKEPLSKELIVETALVLVKSEGSAGLSMRKIAKALDTGPSSLYVYVTNQQELSAYVLDAGLAEVIFPKSDSGTWQSRLFDVLDSYLTVLFEAPGIAELALTTIPVGHNSLGLTEYMLQQLHEAGVGATSAAWGIDLLLLYVSSVAFEQTSRNQVGTTLQAVKASYQSLDAKRYPLLIGLREEMTSADGKARFRWGLEVILQGILQGNRRVK